ncbi:Z1 domain-containing protein [Evansella cellulosilytica]|uniref:Putative endonuclease, Z1 domain n=1 Tax=Evansella cellulosilytica (strain ATCC 21833 / DSM 2522 / FERM P-1141 / JCM 9156 / N-4) TaxID=649639 RepID=E6TR23_EVAC2|nr:Z1 domain-containing protein [Evansella cellulosilytica]ADU29399.1 Putative endonuclease, Z1 domain [Evansella cellulosilytica DSM 2522]
MPATGDKNNMYDQVKEKITDNLTKQSTLKEDTIEKLIEEWKGVIENTPQNLLKIILGLEDEQHIRSLSGEDWNYLKNELEQSFIVKIESGILVTGENQKARDTTWWTSKKQLEIDNYYSSNYMNYMKRNLPTDVLNTIDEDTDAVMNNLADPDLGDFSIYGMVVGHVQSGKTSNYASLICKAADAGYRFIVVIAGALNNLRDQTQKRLDEVFIGANYQGVGQLPGFKREKMPDSLTNADNDFKLETAKARGTTNFENMQLPILVVIKKHTKSLSNLLEWLEKHYKNQIEKAMLVIDDESDYASINTKEEEDPTVINEKIRLLLRKFKKSAYVAYTATPYANIFIDHEAKNEEIGKDLFPEDFIYALEAPSNYFGAEKIFGSEDKKFVVEIPDEDAVYELDDTPYPPGKIPFIIKHKKDYAEELNVLPDTLKDAIHLFLLNIAIRNLRNQRKHNSMLIHISRFTNVHIKVKKLVKEYFEIVKDNILAYGNLDNPDNYSVTIQLMRSTFDTRLEDIEFSFETILRELAEVIELVIIRDAHQKAKDRLVYRDDIQTNVIVIGGLSLSRGYTLEGLSVSYFLRTTVFYDTLMQMGRWFGYRIGYEDLCRIYLTDDLYRKFGFIIEATNDLINRLKDMKQDNLTPRDFGLAVKLHPDSLVQITARNKSKHTEDMYLQMNLDGSMKETGWLNDGEKDISKNEILLRETMNSLLTGGYEHVSKESYVWKNVDKSIVETFVKNYQLYKNDPLGLRSRMPIDFIRKYIQASESNWDVVLFNGKGTESFVYDSITVKRQKRKVKHKEGYFEVTNRQLSRANPERIVMPKEFSNLSSSEMRTKLDKPLLMLHALELRGQNDEFITNAIGFGISFPISGRPQDNMFKVRINNVYKRQLEEALKVENDEIGDYDE